MAQDFKLGGTTLDHMTGADWPPEAGDDQALNGVTPQTRTRLHIWRAAVLPAAEWATLRAAQGQRALLTTVNHADRSGDYRDYPGALLERLDGRHEGPNFVDVIAEFRVRV
ncbi:MAG: hypothetical protein BroJett011_04050 [Chloroflexota bacterium]|nr:MAG: hypothetical protein BroJett011_04050 [Chloroflexota bacterium]